MSDSAQETSNFREQLAKSQIIERKANSGTIKMEINNYKTFK